jgi:ABC-type molybdenum transport system ATPase subunit/photorepair protein PhrA
MSLLFGTRKKTRKIKFQKPHKKKESQKKDNKNNFIKITLKKKTLKKNLHQFVQNISWSTIHKI